MHIADFLRRHAQVRSRQAAFTCHGATFSWQQTADRVNQLSSYLVDELTRGDRVAVFAHNCHRYFEIYLACAKAGMICVPVNSRLLGRELAGILDDAETAMLFVDGALAAEAETALAAVAADIGRVVGYGDHTFALDYESVLAGQPADEVDVRVGADEVSVIAFTSGTTGRPKGAQLTHQACVLSAYSYAMNMRLTDEDRCLASMPAYVYRGGSGGFAPVLVGSETVVHKFEAGAILELIEKARITHATLAPAMIGMLLARADIAERDLSSLRQLWTGGAPIRPETLERLHDLVGEIVGAQYGMTESTGIAIAHYRRGDTDRLRSVGRPTSLVDVRLVQADGGPALAGEVGEIWVRGDAVTIGYWRAPQIDAEVFTDGWFRTGDMATVDPDGYLYLVDRRIDIINSGGINVYSLEVESAIAEHPGVRECAVIGVPDDVYGEAVLAIVVAEPDSGLTADDVVSWAKERLAGFKKPRSVLVVDELERNAMGKINKKGLRQTYWSGQERMVNG